MNSTQNVNMVPIAPSNTFVLPKTADIGRSKRTRAKRSCDMCRKKKTRCDADDRFPCTKCKVNNFNCTFLVEQKKRGPSTGYVEVLESRLMRMEKLLKNIAKKSSDPDEESAPVFKCPKHFPNKNKKTSDQQEEDVMENQVVQKMQNIMITDYERTRYIGSSSGVHLLNQEMFCTNKKHHLSEEPSWFIQKVNHDEEEHIIMKTREIEPSKLVINKQPTIKRFEMFEDVPNMTLELADYLVHSYFTRTHTYCPIINKVQFLEQYYFQTPNPPDKYLLWAIAAIGARLCITNITRIGDFQYSETQVMEIFDSLQQKSYRLLNVVYKRSMLSTIQTLVLMSMFTEAKDGDDGDTSHWFVTGMAIRMAQDMGLHRNCPIDHMPDHEVEIRRRVWYATYIIDRWVAAELGRPITILDHEFDVLLPSPYEVNTTHRTQNAESTPVLLQEADTNITEKRPVYSFFTQMITLSQILGQILVGFYSPRSKHSKSRNWDLVNKIDCNLTNWKMALPQELQLGYPNQGFASESSIIHMAYSCLCILLYRSFITPNDQTENTMTAFKALSVCTASAINLVNAVEQMDGHTIAALPWNIAIYTVFQAAIIFLHNAKGESPYVSKQGREYLEKCAKIYTNDAHLSKTRIFKVLQSLATNYQLAVTTTVDTPSPPSFSDDDKRAGERRKRSNSIISIQSDGLNGFKRMMDNIIEKAKKSPPPKQTRHLNQDAYFNSNDNTCNMQQKQSTLLNDPFNSIGSTRPEDMFITSLSHGIGKTSAAAAAAATNSLSSSSSSPASSTPMYDDNKTNDTPLDFDMLMSEPQQPPQQQRFVDNDLDKMLETLPLPYQQYDMASLTSEIPLWELPSGVTWNDWEAFLKANPTTFP